MQVEMKIGGTPVRLENAYSSVVPHRKCVVGWDADVSGLEPGKDYALGLNCRD